MEKETKDLILKHIEEGTYVSDALFDIQKLLASDGMELYAKPCCDRIKAAGLVDGSHILRIHPSPWKLQMDVIGLERCRHILGSYLQPEYLDEIQGLMTGCQNYNTFINNMLYSLRNVTVEDLRENRTEVLTYKVRAEDVKDIEDLYRAERKRRRLPGRIRRTGSRIVFTWQMLRLYPGPIRMLYPFIAESWRSWEVAGTTPGIESNGKYMKALRRFTDVHGGTSGVGRLRGINLSRYIYLAVKVYGKENVAEVNHTKAVKSCLEIESRYQELKRVMETIGRLSPVELLGMYPVDKEYNGEKWGIKDYFYTMNRLRRLPVDKPIGDAQDVACLLWDYQNQDLEFLLLQWQNVLGDLHIYCNDPGPQDELHDRMMRRNA